MKKNLLTIATILMFGLFSYGCKTNAVTEKSDPKETYINALKKLNEAKFFTALTDLGEGNTMTYSYIAPDKRQATVKRDNHTINTFVIGIDQYLEDVYEPGKFLKMAGSYKEAPVYWQLTGISENLNPTKVKDVKFEKKDIINGKEVFIYQESETGTTLAVSSETGLPLRTASMSSEFRSTTVTKPRNIEVTNFDYDKEPKIEAPTNVK